MAGFKSLYLANKMLDLVHGGQAYSPPGTIYYGLLLTIGTASGGQVEVSGGSYARVAITNNLTNYPAASGGSKKNGVAITWPAPTADWGVCLGVADYDASSGGNLLTVELFSVPVTILNGSPAFSLPVNSGTYTEA